MAVLTVANADFNKGIRPLRGEDFIEDQLGTFLANEDLASGDLVRIRTDNKIEKASGAALGNADVRGFVYKGCKAGQAASVHRRGAVSGYSGIANPGANLFLSNTAGKIDTAAGTVSVVIGFGYRKDEQDVVFINIKE